MKVVICGNYGAQNLGDEMILTGLLETVRAILPKANIAVLSGNPQETTKHFNVQSYKKFPAGITSLVKGFFGSTKETKRVVKSCDYFFLGGGGLFETLTFRAHIIWGIQAFMAYRYKKPVIMYDQSVGKARGIFRRLILKSLFKKAKLIVVRDEKSKSNLRELGIDNEIYVLPDLAFRISIPKPASSRKKQIIVALRQMDDLSLLFKKNISIFLDWLIDKRGYEIKFIDFQGGEQQDYLLHKEIISLIRNQSKIYHLKHDHSIEKVLEEFASADFVLGMRLHSIISAIKTQTPFIALNYAPKIKNFLQYVRLSDHLFDIDQFEVEDLIRKFNEIHKNREKISQKMHEFNETALQAHQKAERLFRQMFS